MSAWVGEQLEGLSYLDDWVMNLLISAAVAGFTEVTSNTATAQLLLPVLGNMVPYASVVIKKASCRVNPRCRRHKPSKPM